MSRLDLLSKKLVIKKINMKQLLFLLLFPCFAIAQYQGNANQKITLGEQTTADGLVWRGIRADTTSKIVPFSDTSAYIILDTVEKTLWLYKTGQVPKWQQVGGSTLDTATMLLPYYRAGRNTIIKAADVPTLNQNTTGSAATLTTGRTIQTNLASTSAATFNGSANITPGVTGVLPVANGGTGQSTLTANKVMVGNGTSGVLTPNLLSWNNSSNYLGVGTSSPVSILDVVGNIPAGGGGGGLRFVPTVANDGTTQYGITISGAGSGAGQFIAIGVRNSTASTKASAMWVEATQPGLNIGYDYTDVAPNNGAIINGEVRIGYTADQGAYPLQVNGQIFATNATIATSDEKFKENITPLNKGLEIVNKLKPVTFNFISDTENNFSEYEEVGFIAQDVDRALSTETFSKSIVKAADDSEPTSTMGLATQNLIPILVKAIQEQQALIKTLEQRILILENK